MTILDRASIKKVSNNYVMNRGLYIVLEGADGSGKTSAMRNVANKLNEHLSELLPAIDWGNNVLCTHHPGCTALGKHIRKLVKFPQEFDQDIKMDSLSRQLLYMVDAVNFTNTILHDATKENKIVLADRSAFISALVYGLADGLTIEDVDRLFSVITPPKIDRLYVLYCSWDVVQNRLNEQRGISGTDGTGKLDHYDSKPSSFAKTISKSYSELVTTTAEQTALISRSVAIDDIVYIDASQDEDVVASNITNDICNCIARRCIV